MGRISRLAKEDGYIIGMAPPQSYLDIDTTKFSRYINLTEPDRPWHNEFHYFGANVYAYLVAKYGDSIDFISVQFYESYSKAAMNLHHHGISQDVYLQLYVKGLVEKNESFFVNFDDDPTLKFSSRNVSVPLAKLVFGFANGWALNEKEKVAFFEAEQVGVAYKRLLVLEWRLVGSCSGSSEKKAIMECTMQVHSTRFYRYENQNYDPKKNICS